VRCAPTSRQSVWPSELPALKAESGQLFDAMQKLADQFFQLAARRWQIPFSADYYDSSEFSAADDISMSNLTLFHYQ
jgi:hypothetical protein